MKNPNIARVLRYYRKLNERSVEDVSKHLDSKNMPAATKTIYAWENGTTQPSADTLMELCSYYQIDNILETFGYDVIVEEEKNSFPLSVEEQKIIKAYRKKTSMQDAVKRLLDVE
nr:helix-turn-helix transcriptional regulator [Eubacterium sp.]